MEDVFARIETLITNFNHKLSKDTNKSDST